MEKFQNLALIYIIRNEIIDTWMGYCLCLYDCYKQNYFTHYIVHLSGPIAGEGEVTMGPVVDFFDVCALNKQ